MLLGQASSSGDMLAVVVALSVGGALLIVIVVRRNARPFWEPRRSGRLLEPDAQPLRRRDLLDSVEHAGRRYSLTPADHQVREWLNELLQWWKLSRIQNEAPIRLVRFRSELRGIIANKPVGGLVSCLSDSDKELRRMAIWLLGHCSGREGIAAVSILQWDPDPVVRRYVAKALKRMREWAELYRMANRDDDLHVRCAASSLSSSTRRSHAERLRQFVDHGGGEVFEPGHYTSHMPVFMPQPIGPGKPAKSRAWIRRILEHIRQLVRFSSGDRAA